MKTDLFVDAKGLACPMPLVRAKKAIEQLNIGNVLEIHTTDRGSLKDLAAWAKSRGHQIIKQAEEQDVFKFWIQKGEKN